jgi:MFS family permease
MTNNESSERLFNVNYVILFISNMIVSVSFSMVTTTMTMYLTGIGITTAFAGTIVGILSLASLFIRPFSGPLCDILNRKYLLMVSSSGIMIAMIGYGVTQYVPLLIFFRILHGVSFALSTTTSMALIADSLPKNKMGQGLGFYAAGQAIGGAFAPSLGIWLGQTINFTTTFSISGVIIGLSVLLLLRLKVKSPEKTEGNRKLKVAFVPSSMFAKEVLLLALVAMSLSITKGVENSYIALYGVSLGLSNVGWYFTVSAAVLFLARMLFSRIGDKHSAKTVFLFSVGMIAMAYGLLISARFTATLILLGCASALRALGMGILQPTVQAKCLKSVAPEQRGRASSTYYLGTDIGQSLAPIAGGVLVDACGYSVMFVAAFIPLVITSAIYLIAEKRKALQ